MSSDGTPEQGATTVHGELLTGSGKECHTGLVCVDGSIIPTALGVNPFATITALAERSVEHIAANRGIKIDYETKNGLLDLFGPPAKRLALTPDLNEAVEIIADAQRKESPGMEFTEIMEGFIHPGGEIVDFKVAENAARGASSSARCFLSVHAWDMDASGCCLLLLDILDDTKCILTVISNPDHLAMLTGTFSCGALGRDPFMILRGKFKLFSDDPRTPNTKNLMYDFDMLGSDGEMFHFNGYKVVDSSIFLAPWRTWKATSTLYVTITRVNDDSIAGRGILHIAPTDFGHELTTFAATGSNRYIRASAASRYFSFFAKQTAGFLFAPFGSLLWPGVSVAQRARKIPPAETIQITASDGVETTLRMWTPVTSLNTTRLSSAVPILFIPGAAVDHGIFAMPTIKLNAIEFFTNSGATCFCITHRVGKTDIAQDGWTTYDARLDIAAALHHIKNEYLPGTKIYVVAHCAGSIALSMGLLDGTITAECIKGITASNVFMNPKFASVNMLKGGFPISFTGLYERLVGHWFSCISTPEDTVVQRILNQALRFYPVGSRRELCNSVICHRSELVFGRYVNILSGLLIFPLEC
jgi:hypothetical protein